MSSSAENQAPLEAHLIDAPPGSGGATPNNVFAADAKPAPGGFPFDAPVKRRSGGVTAIAVLAIILGALGFPGACGQLINVATGGKLQTAFTPAQPGVPQKMQDAQDKMNDAMLDVMQRYGVVNAVFGGLLLFLAAALVWYGIKTLRMSDSGRRRLRLTMMLLVPFEAARAIPTAAMQIELTPVIQQSMTDTMEAARPPGKSATPQEQAVLEWITWGVGVVMWVVVVGMIGWSIAKMMFYGLSARHLSRPSVVAEFAAADGAADKGAQGVAA